VADERVREEANMSPMASASVGVYGKIPAQADFVRGNVGELSRLGLDRWFQDAHEVVHSERSRLPDAACFVLAPAGAPVVGLGALVRSEDSVGRSFPLIILGLVEARGLAETFPALPQAYARFFDAALAVAESAPTATAAELTQRAADLAPALVAEPTANAHALLAHEGLDSIAPGLGGVPGGAAYGLRTLITGCDRAKAAPTGGPTGVITIDAPAPSDAARLFWLELARRRLGWRDVIPTAVWMRQSPHRLLVTLGPPPTTLFAFLANSRHKNGRFWPLRTEVMSARDSALAALTADQRRVLEAPQSSLADALAVFA
jgi:type VI secretion system protein ImpM